MYSLEKPELDVNKALDWFKGKIGSGDKVELQKLTSEISLTIEKLFGSKDLEMKATMCVRLYWWLDQIRNSTFSVLQLSPAGFLESDITITDWEKCIIYLSQSSGSMDIALLSLFFHGKLSRRKDKVSQCTLSCTVKITMEVLPLLCHYNR